jgi:hypothetical protein
MEYSLSEIILAAGNSDEESAFLMQMLALVILAALAGVGSLIKTRKGKFKKRMQYYPKRARSRYSQPRWKIKTLKEFKNKCFGIFSKTVEAKAIIEGSVSDFDAGDTADQERPGNKSARKRVLTDGMELLEVDFLVSTVENTKGDDKNEVMMRKFTFNELVRRERLDTVNSKPLKVYAINEDNLYGKNIQCEAMKELTRRTRRTERF